MLGAVAGTFRAGDVLQGLESISKHSVCVVAEQFWSTITVLGVLDYFFSVIFFSFFSLFFSFSF